jgi:hypothetical protein
MVPHGRINSMDPWIIEELEQERRRREEEEAQRIRIELPQTAPADEKRDRSAPGGRVLIVDISPPDEHTLDV